MNYRSLLALFGLIVLFSSCATTKDKKSFTYFNNLPKDSIYIVKDQGMDIDSRLKSGDVLSIRVSTLDPETNVLFNEGVLSNNGGAGSAGGGSIQAVGYKLDKNGDIYVPLIGKLNVAGKTPEEAQAMITQKISTQVKNPIVSVRLLNAQVMVMGEVGSPGLINISDRKTTVIEAIGLAGEIKVTGNKKEVLVVRSNQGNKEHVYLNLDDIKTLSSPYFYLHQDDLIIVNPTIIQERNARGAISGSTAAQLGLGFLGGALGVVNMILIIRKN